MNQVSNPNFEYPTLNWFQLKIIRPILKWFGRDYWFVLNIHDSGYRYFSTMTASKYCTARAINAYIWLYWPNWRQSRIVNWEDIEKMRSEDG